jgi:DNA-binding transcriptional LysR family regulator
LRVTAPVALGRGEFIDFVSEFAKKYSKLRLELTITNQFVDLVATRVDVAIRFGKLADSSVIARRLGFSQRMLAASPEYLKRRGAPRSPRELSECECVVFRGETEGKEWHLHSGRRRTRIRVTGSVAANNLESVNELAIRGHGVALLPEPYLLAGEAAGSLKRVLPRWTSAPIPVHAVYLERKFLPAKLRTFVTELSSFENSTWRAEPRC